jgi:hypothetical protein
LTLDFVSIEVGLLDVLLVLGVIFIFKALHALQWRLGAALQR